VWAFNIGDCLTEVLGTRLSPIFGWLERYLDTVEMCSTGYIPSRCFLLIADPSQLLDRCPKAMFSSGARYKAETGSLLFLVVRGWGSACRRGDGSLVPPHSHFRLGYDWQVPDKRMLLMVASLVMLLK
jgi:hypothetical protein